MPAERSRNSKRCDVDGAQLTWTTPVEPVTHSIAFAPTLTPVTFNDPPQSLDDSQLPALFPSPSSECPSRRSGHGKKRPENHIPRPPNAFILFRSSFIKSQHVSTEVETNHSTLSKIIGLTWQNMPHEERQIWHAKAKAALEEHRRKWPQYAFRPSQTKGKGGTEKRKVREVEPKDVKRCAKIAELLVEGKKGQELDAAIQEFDRHHVPEIVTRFEVPITARMYRRSSSAPVVDPQSKQPFLSSSSPSSSSRRLRACSTQPALYPAPSNSKVEEPLAAPTFSDEAFYQASFSPSFVPSPAYSFPEKPQPSFEFDPYLFDVAFGDSICSGTLQQENFPCTPKRNRVPSPTLSIDTTFTDEWSPRSSPFSSMPATPRSRSLHSPCYDQVAMDSSDPFDLNAFNISSFAGPYDIQHHQSHGYANDAGIFGHPLASDGSMFNQVNDAPYSKHQFSPFEPAKTELANVDLDFTAFMSSLPAF